MPRKAVLYHCLSTFQHKDGAVRLEQVWWLSPDSGDGERRCLGLVAEVSEAEALRKSTDDHLYETRLL